MGFSSKIKSSSESWGLDLLLLLFPDEDYGDDKYTDKRKKLFSFRRSNSNLLVNRAQSTIFICVLIIFFTILLFTLCNLEPAIHSPNSLSRPKFHSVFPRRWLAEDSRIKKNSSFSSSSGNNRAWLVNVWRKGVNYKRPKNKVHKRNRRSSSSSSSSDALQGMGTLFLRGTKAMNDLVVAHLGEETKLDDLRLFMRSLYRLSLTAKSDLVFLFPSSSEFISSNFSAIIKEESEAFLKRVHNYRKNSNDSISKLANSFDLSLTQFVEKKKEKQRGKTLWGRGIQSNYSTQKGREEEEEDELTQLSWGSVVSFDATELDPEDSLTGFLNNVPMSFRRWACYPMLLGRVRRNFKHVMLVDVKNTLLLGDAFARVRNRSSESVILSAIHGKHHRKNSEKTQTHNEKESKSINSAIIMGGMRGIRRLSNAMLTEIVRAAIQRKNKTLITESVVFNKLVQSDSLLKNIHIITTTESILA